MRGRWLLLCLLGACALPVRPRTVPVPSPAPGELASSLFLVGDGGAPAPGGEPVLAALRTLLLAAPDSTAVVFLGDNIYPRGLPAPGAPGRAEAERRLLDQARATAVGGVRTWFVPGNHDWDKSGKDGLAAIRRQGALLAAEGGGRAVLLPAAGCPGPAVVELGALRLVLLDTEWWLTPHQRPGSDACPNGTGPAVLEALARAIREAGGRPVVVAAHHPLATGGEHGGNFGYQDHLFPLRKLHPALLIPLPLIGSAYPVVRGAGYSDEDLSGGRNIRMRAAFDSVFACSPPLLYAAGHEHNLQLIDRGRPPLLAVSGSGIHGHTSIVTGIPGTRLALSEAGFMRLDHLVDGRLRLGVWVVDRRGRSREVHAEWLTVPEAAGGTPCEA